MVAQDPHDLTRFVTAQKDAYATALAELTAGRKTSHWMWFVFPQVVGLGHSDMAVRYAIGSLAEARAYLDHPLLGARLRDCTAAVLSHQGVSARQLLGPIDDVKLRSSMTLFEAVDTRGGQFSQVLDRYYDGVRDPLTLAMVAEWADARTTAGADATAALPPAVPTSMWEQPEVAARFAERPPDHRLVKLFRGEDEYAPVKTAWSTGPKPRVLDLGCAGGRNTVWLAEQGADVRALDASRAMVAETRRRLAAVLGAREAAWRVTHGYMHDLGEFVSGEFDLVVALGVLQDAQSDAEWHQALSELARVLHRGGLALVANFAPDSAPDGKPLRRDRGTQDVWVGFGSPDRRMTLPDLERLDEHFLRHGLERVLPTEQVRVETAGGQRVTLNALYKKV